MSEDKDNLNEDELVGNELDELNSDFDFDESADDNDTLKIYSESNDTDGESIQSEPKRKTKATTMIVVLLIIVSFVAGYLYISGFNFSSDNKSKSSGMNKTTPSPEFISTTPKTNHPNQPTSNTLPVTGMNRNMIEDLIAKNNDDLFLRINGIMSNIQSDLQKKINNQSATILATSQDYSEVLFVEKFKVWDENEDILYRDEEKIMNQKELSNANARKELAARIGYIEKEIEGLVLLFASTKTDYDDIARNYEDLKVSVMNVSSKYSHIQSINQSSGVLDKILDETKPKKSINDFKSYQLIGFDRQKKSVWIKDDNDNVIKVVKSSYLPEYGTIKSITEDGKIITELGFVKIKPATN